MTLALLWLAIAFWLWFGWFVGRRFFRADPGPLTEREAKAVEETQKIEAIARAIEGPPSNVVQVDFRRVGK